MPTIRRQCRNCPAGYQVGRGLCWVCFRDPTLLDRFPAAPRGRKPTPPPARECRHCRVRVANGTRGLCRGCQADPAVKGRYAPLRDTGRPPKGDPTAHMTAAELDAVIAEEMARLPAWWAKHADWQRRLHRGSSADRLLYAIRRLQRRA